MDKIIIGLLKSNHNIKLKKALLEKLIEKNNNNSQSEVLDINKFIYELENIWCIGDYLQVTLDQYESLKQHADVIIAVLKYAFKQQTKQINFDDLITNCLITKIKLTILPNPNPSGDNTILIKNNLLILILWSRLIIEASFEFNSFNTHAQQFNLVNILNILNINFRNSATHVNYLYFIQNDTKFCSEYLKLFGLLGNLIDLDSIKDNSNDYIENCIFETICLLIVSICKDQKLNEKDQELFKNVKVNIKESFENLNEIVRQIKHLLNKSSRLFELTLKYLVDILCTEGGGDDNRKKQDESNSVEIPINKNLNLTTVEIFKCFDLEKAGLIIQSFFQQSQNSVDDIIINRLLKNLILFLSWPFENNIDEWICSLMTIIAIKSQKFQLLISICEENCDFLLRLMYHKTTRRGALNVLSFFLINYQHSPKLFHRNCSKIVRLLEKLKPKSNEDTNSSEKDDNFDDQKSYYNLSLLSFICMTNFGGYPQIYKPIIDLVQNNIDLSNYESFKAKYLIDKSSVNLKNFSEEGTDADSDYFSGSSSTSSSYSSNIDEIGENVNKKLRKNVTGLVNLGNTCYLNCIVQSLFACKKFVKSLLEANLNVISDVASISPNDVHFLQQLQILFAILYLSKRHAIKATNFIKLCTPKWFKIGQQQDSSEFLIYLLDNLDEQLKKLNSPLVSNLIKQSFGIQLTTECICSNCKTKTKRNDVCFYLPLSFSPMLNNGKEPAKRQPIQTLVDNFFSSETLSTENDNPYSCSKCESLQSAIKQVKITRDTLDETDETKMQPPNYLILTLNRFVYQQDFSNSVEIKNSKIMEQLDYPYEIEINTYHNDEIVKEKYKIVSIVVHSGSNLHYGHYYSYVTNYIDKPESELKDNPDSLYDYNEWLLANDSQITETSFDSLISNINLFKDDTPYVLFYTRVNSNSSNSDTKINISNSSLIDIIEKDNRLFEIEEGNRILKNKRSKTTNFSYNKFSNKSNKDDDDDDQDDPHRAYYPKDSDSGPRMIF